MWTNSSLLFLQVIGFLTICNAGTVYNNGHETVCLGRLVGIGPNTNFICVLSGDWGLAISYWMKCILKYHPLGMTLIMQSICPVIYQWKDRFLFKLMEMTALSWDIKTHKKYLYLNSEGWWKQDSINKYKECFSQGKN